MARIKDLADTIDVLLTLDQWQRHSVEWLSEADSEIKLLIIDDEGTQFCVTVEYERGNKG